MQNVTVRLPEELIDRLDEEGIALAADVDAELRVVVGLPDSVGVAERDREVETFGDGFGVAGNLNGDRKLG